MIATLLIALLLSLSAPVTPTPPNDWPPYRTPTPSPTPRPEPGSRLWLTMWPMQPLIVKEGQRITVEYDVRNIFSTRALCGIFWIKEGRHQTYATCAQPPHNCLAPGQSTGCNAVYIVTQEEIAAGVLQAAAFAVVIGSTDITASNTATFVIGRAAGVTYLPMTMREVP
jgi:hypothetical protein